MKAGSWKIEGHSLKNCVYFLFFSLFPRFWAQTRFSLFFSMIYEVLKARVLFMRVAAFSCFSTLFYGSCLVSSLPFEMKSYSVILAFHSWYSVYIPKAPLTEGSFLIPYCCALCSFSSVTSVDSRTYFGQGMAFLLIF